MATEITHEGQVYVLKSDVEGIVRERVGKVAEQANSWETKAKEAASRLTDAEKRATTADTLAQQVQALTAERDRHASQYQRYTAAVQAGISDQESIEALEWAHSRAMGAVAEKDRIGFPEWLSACKTRPDIAPAPLRHLFAPPATPPAAVPGQPAAPLASAQAPQATPPVAPPWASAARGTTQPPPPVSGLTPQDIAAAPIGGKAGREATERLLQQWQQTYGPQKSS